MTAREMFEKLGYYLNKDYDEDILSFIHIQDIDGERHFGITFNLRDKCFHIWHFGYDKRGHCDNNMNLSINIDLFKAINKQVSELGWLG